MRAIETVYKGYRFRSRLEARWAVFFDALELHWEYEPEGFELGDGLRYLPDFRVTYPGRGEDESHHEWFEVKGDLRNITQHDWEKMLRFDKGHDRLFILDGVPEPRMYLTPARALDGHDPELTITKPYCLHKSSTLFERCGWALWCPKGRVWWDDHENFFSPTTYFGCADSEIERACVKARSARFEFGEAGA